MGQPPHAGLVKMGTSIRGLEQGTGLMEGTCLCLHLTPILDDSSEMERNWVFSPFHYNGAGGGGAGSVNTTLPIC